MSYTNMTQTMNFVVTGTIEIPSNARLLYAHDGGIRGFVYDGNEVSLTLALELNGGNRILSNESEMEEIAGVENIDYDTTSLEYPG